MHIKNYVDDGSGWWSSRRQRVYALPGGGKESKIGFKFSWRPIWVSHGPPGHSEVNLLQYIYDDIA